jgi:NAD(P)-dependent dehydrogenase (short-subunit alcohol dehydrogenase family)
MKARGHGAIVVTASPHATRTVPDAGAYAASKGGALALTKAMALEAAASGVRVNAVVPGAIDTPMLRREAAVSADPEEQLRRFGAMQPVGRRGRPEEVADGVVFHASDRAGFITGATLHVDGGQDAALSSGPPLPYGS